MKKHMKLFEDFSNMNNRRGKAMKGEMVNFDLYLVIEEDYDYFYNTILPELFKALVKYNVLFRIEDHDSDGSTHIVLTGTQGAIENVVRTAFSDDDGVLDQLEEPGAFYA